MHADLNNTFAELCSRYTGDEQLVAQLWAELVARYSEKHRHYHTLQHLENLLRELQGVKHFIADWDAVVFCLYYHDVVYNSSKSDNEEMSAQLALERMRSMGVPTDRIDRCWSTILATKAHAIDTNSDINYFTDADLSILGAEPTIYAQYAAQVRKEYSIYPDVMYNMGRKKVLQHFLRMQRIFKTAYFYELYEQPARQNLQRELDGEL